MSEETELVVRCEVDGVLKHKGQDELLSVKALNEFDPKLTGDCCSSQSFTNTRLPSYSIAQGISDWFVLLVSCLCRKTSSCDRG